MDRGCCMSFIMKMIFALSSLVTFLSFVNSEWLIGDACEVRDGTKGECTPIMKCPSVYHELVLGKTPEICGENTIVCCPLVVEKTTFDAEEEEEDVDTRGGIARRKCSEYAEFLYVDNPPDRDFSAKPENTSFCGILDGRSADIIGFHSEPKEFPHMAAVGYEMKNGTVGWFCDGTLISENHVLTAAQCVNSEEWGKAMWVRFGNLNLGKTDDLSRPQTRRIWEVIQHPEYRKSPLKNDLAILRLEVPVDINPWVRPACLHGSPTTETEKAIATQWGHDKFVDEDFNHLLRLIIPLVKNCTGKDTDAANNGTPVEQVGEDRFLCAFDPEMNSCENHLVLNAKSGGPLVIYTHSKWCMYDLVGVSSIMRPCGETVPNVYTRVYSYLPWIQSVVWPSSM